jgi:drug/metabolite transporter (DMT)-like permease
MASPLDTTGVGIVAGLIATVAYTLTRALRQKSFDIQTTLLIFLAGFSIPGGAHLIRAAWSGNPNDLPSNWREYVTVAGIAAIGLSAHYLVQSFRYVWPKRATISPPSAQSDEASRADDDAS